MVPLSMGFPLATSNVLAELRQRQKFVALSTEILWLSPKIKLNEIMEEVDTGNETRLQQLISHFQWLTCMIGLLDYYHTPLGLCSF